MTLKLVADTLEGLPEAVAALYTKGEDGKFKLGVDGVPDVTNLTKALKAERELREKADREAKELAKRYDGLDPDEARRLMQQFEGSEEAKLIKEGKIDQVVAKKMERQSAEYAKQIKTAQDAAKAATDRATRVMQRIADGIARDAAIKAGIHQYAVDDFVLATRAEGWSLNEKEELVLLDVDGAPVLGKDGKTPLTVMEAAESKRETRPHWFPAQSSGSGSKQSYGGAGPKVMKRAQFDALPARDRAAAMKSGVTLQD